MTALCTRIARTHSGIRGLALAVRASAGQSLDTLEPAEVTIERADRDVPGLARNFDDQAV
jgi:hypothetical protein